MSIAINDVGATKVSVECHDCAKTKQIKALSTCSYFIVAKVETCALKNLILSFLLHTQPFIDLPDEQVKLENNLPEAISACLGQT